MFGTSVPSLFRNQTIPAARGPTRLHLSGSLSLVRRLALTTRQRKTRATCPEKVKKDGHIAYVSNGWLLSLPKEVTAADQQPVSPKRKPGRW